MRAHDVILCSPRQVRNALVDVLHNAKKHRAKHQSAIMRALDSFASGIWFDGWRDRPRAPRDVPDCPTSRAHTWLLRTGWRRHGLLGLSEIPRTASG